MERKRERVSIEFDRSLGKTQQNHAEETDINVIVDRWLKGGQPPVGLDRARGFYGDVSNVGDFKQVMDTYHEAQEAFMGLPAALRARFRNDPAELVDFMADPENQTEAAELGLVEAVEEPRENVADPGKQGSAPKETAAPEGEAAEKDTKA